MKLTSAAAAALCVAFVAVGWAQQSAKRPVPAWPAGLVRIDAIVERDLGGVVPPLTSFDFTILCDGQPVPTGFFSADPSPLSVALLVDVTDSLTSVSQPREFKQALADFITIGLVPGDRARVGGVGDVIYWTSTMTGDRRELTKAAEDVLAFAPVHGQGPSPIWDGIETAIGSLSSEPGRRAVIVISDGQSTGNVRGSDDVAKDAAVAGVSVHAIAERSLGGVITIGAGVDQTKILRAMAELTGGTTFVDGFAPAPRDPAKGIRTALDRLHHAYTLGFRPLTADGRLHAIEVRVLKPGLVVRARKQFLADQR